MHSNLVQNLNSVHGISKYTIIFKSIYNFDYFISLNLIYSILYPNIIKVI